MYNRQVKVTSGNLYFYVGTGTATALLSTHIRMTDPVDRDILQKAVDTAMKRYPYLCVRPGIIDGSYYLMPNNLPFVVTDDGEFTPLGEAASNYHLITFSCKDDEIMFNFDHGLMDGRGSTDPIRSVLYYYCRFRYGRDFDCPGVKTADSPIAESEYECPYERELPPFDTMTPAGNHTAFALPEPKTGADGLCRTTAISVNQKAFMKVAKSMDSSPASLGALLMLKAVEDVHPEHAEEICCAVAMDSRDAVGIPETHQNVSSTFTVFYPEKMKKLPLETQGTCIRGQIILQTDPGCVLKRFEAEKNLYRQACTMETAEEKRDMYRSVLSSAMAVPLCSYVGRYEFGEIDKYIRSMHFLNNGFGGRLLEITAIGEDFGFDFNFGVEKSEYLAAYLRQFDALGIPYRHDREFLFRLPVRTY
ncbi:MAG: hypothetical protein HUJ76_05195 [Parasporobacterium sp.]|nr:hypothetical protein [Parasporobacterium sp.]